MAKVKRFKPKNKPYGPKSSQQNRNDVRMECGVLVQNVSYKRPPSDVLNQKQSVMPKESLREVDVGITEFLGSSSGFVGVLKSRFSDFHVNEIDMNGKVLYLTNLELPKVNKDVELQNISAVKEAVSDILTADVWQKMEDLAQKTDVTEPIALDVSQCDREKRTQMHALIKFHYAGILLAHTKSDASAGTRTFEIFKSNNQNQDNRHQFKMDAPFVHFILHKENIDSTEVVSMLAQRLKIPSSFISYAGTKDRRAKTTQKICIKRRAPHQIIKVIKNMRGVHGGNFEFNSTSLSLGQLQGNRFRIAVRHIRGDEAQIELALNELKTVGFINYYGLQRFGNCASVPTYMIGMALLKRDYKLAVELILKPREQDNPDMAAARQKWWTDRNSEEAAKMLTGPNRNSIEKQLLLGLVKFGPNNYVSALEKIPRNTILLYIHSVQSIIFNKMTSRRIKEFGLKLVEGDLVYADQSLADDSIEDIFPVNDNTKDVVDEDVNLEAQSKLMAAENAPLKKTVLALTQNDIESGKYTIFDVVLPLPGHDVIYPNNAMKTWYEEQLQADGLAFDMLKNKLRGLQLSGTYRKLLIQPGDMVWKYAYYDEVNSHLIASDWDRIRNDECVLAEVERNLNATSGKYKALIVEFNLPAAVYATMALRQLLKSDTSAGAQTKIEKDVLTTADVTDS